MPDTNDVVLFRIGGSQIYYLDVVSTRLYGFEKWEPITGKAMLTFDSATLRKLADFLDSINRS